MENKNFLPALATILMCIVEHETEESILLLKKIPKKDQKEAKNLIKKLQAIDAKFRQFCINILVLSETPNWN